MKKPLDQAQSFKDHLVQAAEEAKERAKALPPGAERDALLKKARQAETARHIDRWISSPGLRPPT
jgi:hypothetical protein